jgi:hypothetical protein
MLIIAPGELVKNTSNSNNILKCVQLMFESKKIVVSNVKITTSVFLTCVLSYCYS